METVLYTSEGFNITHNIKMGILRGEFINCETSDAYTSAIKAFREIYEKVKSPYTLWDNKTFFYDISDSEKIWTENFLNKPCVEMGFFKKVGILISPCTSGFHSVISLFDKAKSNVWPGLFLDESQALDWILQKELKTITSLPKISINTATEGRINLNMEISPDELSFLMRCFKNILSDQSGIRMCYRRFLRLTKQEQRILEKVTQGLYNKEIAEELCISIETVKTHRKNILHKLECHNILDLKTYKVFL